MTPDNNDSYPLSYTRTPHITSKQYHQLYKESIQDPATFWATQAHEHITWYKEWDTVNTGDFEHGNMRWFDGGTLNVSYNCIDRHILRGHGANTALIWERNDGTHKKISYRELLENVSKLANVLKERGVKKGDRVCIYMPMIPEAAYAMLACARIGAVHSVVFGGFSSEALAARIQDAHCTVVITADIGTRGNKVVLLKEQVDRALQSCPHVHTSLIVRTDDTVPIAHNKTDIDYAEAVAQADATCEPEVMQAEDPLFILYTSGSTGKPKGVLHTTGGYLVYASVTHKYIFDYHEGDVYWCAADVGWITGHTYVIYGPLANGATTLLYEGVPTYPTPARYWEIIDKHKVDIFYSTPTALRSLMALGDDFVKNTSRKSLKVLGTVGEPINPEAWRWYHHVVGEERCPIVDTWWQTETGGIAITPLPGATALKPGAAVQPFFGIQPVIVDNKGNELAGEATGKLMLKGSWPGQMRDLYNDHDRFMDVYFRAHPGLYLTGDGVRRDKDGCLWITGRIDDTINTSGHLIGTAEIESALVLHDAVAEAAVVTIPDDIKLESIYAFVTLMHDTQPSEKLKAELTALVKKEIGSFAKPSTIHFAPGLPKTRSGKIMRRILRKIARGETEDLGDTSTLAEPEVVTALIDSVSAHK